MIRPPAMPGLKYGALIARSANTRPSAALVAEVMKLWDRSNDTHQIARELFKSEALVARALAIGREERRRQRPWQR